MTSYNDFNYEASKKPGKWVVIYPSGWKTTIMAQSEDELKLRIDEVIALFNAG